MCARYEGRDLLAACGLGYGSDSEADEGEGVAGPSTPTMPALAVAGFSQRLTEAQALKARGRGAEVLSGLLIFIIPYYQFIMFAPESQNSHNGSQLLRELF